MDAAGAAPQGLSQGLSDDAFVMLDPAVEIFVESATFSVLCQTDLEVAMVVPPGEGILELVRSLMGNPVGVGALRDDYDDRALIDGMLASLLAHGLAHVTTQETPSDEALAQLRATAYRRVARTRRRAAVIDLDVPASLEQRGAAWREGGTTPEVVLRCSRLAEHEAALGALARQRQDGVLRAHHVIVRTTDARCDAATRASLLRMGAAVEIEAVPWPAPDAPVPGLAELARHRISTHVIMCPDASILDERVRARTIEWILREFVSGLCVRLDPKVIWGSAAVTQDELAAVFDAVRAIEVAVGDVVVMEMPSDEVLLGNAERPPLPADRSDMTRRLRLAYLRWRVPIVKSFEGSYVWPQIPDVEDKWIRPSEDLLPNHPELLLLKEGSSIADVCGGLGRVARRLAPAIGRDGVIVSIEMRRVMTERARHFACERDLTNLQFRPGIAQRLPLPDGSVDAAVNEWTGVIWDLGLGPAMVKEMARVVRPGGRIAVTHRLVQLRLGALDQPWVQYKDIYRRVRAAFEQPELAIVAERMWGQTVPSVGGEKVRHWLEQYMPRLVPNDGTFVPEDPDPGATVADVFLTLVAERLPS
jgi:ubiquinone/menaquinone biosynthesis C-methylase UbiE